MVKLLRPCVFGLAIMLSACTTLPEDPARSRSQVAAPSVAGELSAAASAVRAEIADDESAFLLIPKASEAMLWRQALIDSAVQSIDIQYFIWKDDASGSLLMEHLMAAADRGVRVRLLVDDMFLSTGGAFDGADQALAAVDYHPGIELRLFNPGNYRSGILGLSGNFGLDLKTYNRRMHNKLMLVDGHFAILGGRNIGDEYFGLHEPYNFLDLDVLVAGVTVGEVGAAFDEYWNADLAYPAAALGDADQSDLQEFRLQNSEHVQENNDRLGAYVNHGGDWSQRLQALPSQMQPGYGVFLQDEPVTRGEREFRLYDMLDDMVTPGNRELIISTPYLIPVGPFLDHLEEDVSAGVEVRILTNSLASNDATPAHSHYKKYRPQILATGASLFELHHQPEGGLRDLTDHSPNVGGFVGLHVKASAVDSQRCFIGSLNIDPRSVKLNTENGLYIESDETCDELQRFLGSLVKYERAWSVTQDEAGKLKWTSFEGTTDSQPAQGSGQRMADFFFRMLPVESQL